MKVAIPVGQDGRSDRCSAILVPQDSAALADPEKTSGKIKKPPADLTDRTFRGNGVSTSTRLSRDSPMMRTVLVSSTNGSSSRSYQTVALPFQLESGPALPEEKTHQPSHGLRPQLKISCPKLVVRLAAR